MFKHLAVPWFSACWHTPLVCKVKSTRAQVPILSLQTVCGMVFYVCSYPSPGKANYSCTVCASLSACRDLKAPAGQFQAGC